MTKLDADEKELLESVERGEWKSAAGGKRERVRYARSAKATLRKDRRLNIDWPLRQRPPARVRHRPVSRPVGAVLTDDFFQDPDRSLARSTQIANPDS